MLSFDIVRNDPSSAPGRHCGLPYYCLQEHCGIFLL
jgi:hypothetical protein